MKGPYLENHEMDAFNKTLSKSVLDSTISCWVGTRIKKGSASLCCEGNVSIPLLKAFDNIYEIAVENINNPKLSKYEQGMVNIKTLPEPGGQKFPRGSRVRIADKLGDCMQHFTSGVDATVLYVYAHAFGGSDVKSYCLDIDGEGSSAWYKERQLTAIDS